MHIAEVVTIAKSLPLLRLNTYKSLILSYSADYRRIFSENIDTCSTCTLNKKCSLMTCRLRNYDQGNSFYNKPIECAVDYSIAL